MVCAPHSGRREAGGSPSATIFALQQGPESTGGDRRSRGNAPWRPRTIEYKENNFQIRNFRSKRESPRHRFFSTGPFVAFVHIVFDLECPFSTLSASAGIKPLPDRSPR
jgi:hypothetical protein